jgi:LCP family protein required for cell wall assembly
MPKKYIYIVMAVLVACLIAVCALTLALGREGGKSEEVYSPKLASDSYCVLVTGRDRASGLSDVIMLVSFDPSKSRICVLQIPRDTYALYGNGKYRKLNGAQRALGEDGFCGLLEDSLDIGIDGYVSLDLSGFRELVDLIGGVEIELAEPLYYKDPYQNLTISLDKGRHKLDGKTAEQFIRYRSGYENGDIGRIDAQKLFMVSLFKSISEKNSPLMLTKIFSVLAGKTDTNMGLTDIGMLSPVLAGVSTEKIYFATAPGEAVVASKSGASYYSLSASGMSELLKNYFGGNGTAFDPRRAFLNNSYDDFVRVYNGYTAPSVRSAYDIEQSGVKNATIHKG